MDSYNVLPELPDWTPEKNRAWLDAAIQRGDNFLIVSRDISGEFAKELCYLLRQLTETN